MCRLIYTTTHITVVHIYFFKGEKKSSKKDRFMDCMVVFCVVVVLVRGGLQYLNLSRCIHCLGIRPDKLAKLEDVCVKKKNQLDATEWFIALIICSKYFGHFYDAHHQELEIICVLLPPMVCSGLVAGYRGSGAG
jgi:hypothetical protein